MIAKLDILYGVAGQVVFYDCPQGRPSSVTSVDVFEDGEGDTSDGEDAITGSASIESVTTTLDDDAGPGEADPTLVPVASTTGFEVGRRYLLTNALGQTEWIEIAGINSGVAVYSRTPLMNTYASGDDLESTRVEATIDTTWASNDNNVSAPLCPRPRYRLVWTYVASGTTYRVATFADLVRYPFSHSVTAQDVDRLSRGWLYRLAAEDRPDAGAELIEEAAYQVRLDLWERELAGYAQRNGEVVNELIRRKAVALVHEQALLHGGIAQALADYSAKAYWDRVDALVPKSNQQVTADGAGAQVRLAPLLRR